MLQFLVVGLLLFITGIVLDVSSHPTEFRAPVKKSAECGEVHVVLFVAGAAFGEIHVSLFVASAAAFGEVHVSLFL